MNAGLAAGMRPMVPIVLTVLLAAASLHSYLLFHTLAELFSIVVAVAAFLVAWNGYAFYRNHFLMFLGIGLFWTGALDLMHTLVYKGMGAFGDHDTNPATQFWVATRFLQALSLLVAPVFLVRALQRGPWMLAYGLCAAAVYAAVFGGRFPDAFVEGRGLTPFKIHAEYVIIAVLAAAMAHLWLRRRLLEKPMALHLGVALALLIASEAAFTQYLSPYGPANLVGHLFKLLAYWLFYVALVEFALHQPIQASQRLERKLRQANEHLEQRVSERTVQLEAANEEMEAFAYSASHDLRAPLRAIGGFAAALEEDYGPRLDAQAADYVRRIRGASDRMAQIIEDLLQLSRLTRSDIVPEEVDLGAMARAVAQELLEREPGRKVELRIADVPRARVDARLMRAALENLLGNAIKFTGKREHALVELDAAEANGETVYRVRDNGAGFDPAHAERLFTPFFRMHPASEFPGTGIGLATVRRIIQRHGGRIWAEGAPGRGATFSFILPAGHEEGGASQ